MGAAWTATAAPPQGLLPASLVVETLDNGLQVVVMPLPGTGLVAHQAWVRAGSGREVRLGETGYAHFFEHLMFHGTASMPREQREAALLRMGVTENAWTSDDATVYHQLAGAGRIGELMSIEADRFAHLNLTAEGVRREAGAVQGELRKGKASPDRAALDGLTAAAFRVHPYHHSTIGLDEDVAAMGDGLGSAQRFFADWYRPDNVTVVVAGDVDPQATLDEMRASWGRWEAAPREPVSVPVEPPQDGLRRVQIVWDSGPANPRLALGWKVPAYVPGAPDAAARALLPELLASRVAPLRRQLVEEDRLANWLYMPTPDPRDPGLVVMLMELRDGVDPATAEAAVHAAVDALKGGAEDDPELALRVQRAAARARRSAVLELDAPDAWASALGRASLYRGQPRDLQREVRALGAVDLNAVQAAAREVFVDERLTVLTLVPPDLAQDDLPSPPIGPPLSPPDGAPGEVQP
jgi:zinc protease